MRKFLGTLVIIALIVAGVGFYRGWFGVSADDQPGETNVELRIDKEKIREDAVTASEKARNFGAEQPSEAADEPGEATAAEPDSTEPDSTGEPD